MSTSVRLEEEVYAAAAAAAKARGVDVDSLISHLVRVQLLPTADSAADPIVGLLPARPGEPPPTLAVTRQIRANPEHDGHEEAAGPTFGTVGEISGPSEDEIRRLEDQFPALAQAAVRRAYWEALASGSVVLVRDGDDLVEVSPDGTRRVVHPLPPARRATVGEGRDLP